MTIQCSECNHENRVEARFCAACGASLAGRCPSCGAVAQSGAEFCDACGASLKAPADVAHAEPASAGAAVEEVTGADAERRHLTVLFCDLVDSSKLSGQLDPEDFRDLLAAYQDCCADAVTAYDGSVARYVGDGLLVYFGYPHAHEDDARRAVRAALDIVDRIARLDLDPDLPVDALAVRIGIATGNVVVGDIGTGERREQMAVVGDTPNLAARLQTLAGPGEILIGAETRGLVRGFFDIDDLGAHDIKGLSQAQSVYRVRAASDAHDRLEASERSGLTPLVGRREEVGILLERWHKACQGETHLVAVSGEAGIGKSRVVRAFREELIHEPHSRVLYFGSPYGQNSAFHPVIDQIERALRFDGTDGVETRREKLETEVRRLGLDVDSVVPPLTALLSLDKDEPQRAAVEAGDLKQRQLQAIGDVIEAMSAENPVLMVVEDIHWLDPSSLELLDALSNRLTRARLLIVMTHRPEFSLLALGGSHLTQIPLSHLGGLDSTAIISRVAGNKPLPDEVVAEIIGKTDGIPLFVEELTKSLLESGVLRDDGRRFVLDSELPPLAIPPSLQDSLMARLDRLATTKDVAQLAACIGRDFNLALLRAVATLDEAALYGALDRLVEAGLVFERGVRPDSSFEFNHALVRDAAYDSLLKSSRQLNHQRIAQALESQFEALAETQPELVARHYTEAGLVEAAVIWWYRAGRRAARLGANEEAIRHLENGLELVTGLEQTDDHARLEADLSLELGNVVRLTEGHASERAEGLFSHCRLLYRKLSDREREFPALWGLWSVAMSSGALDEAVRLAEHALALARDIGDPDLELEGHHTLWGTYSSTGDPVATLHHAEFGMKLYRFEQHRDFGFTYGNHDPGVCARYSSADALWLLGYSERAREQLADAIQLIDQHTQPQFIAHGLAHCRTVFMLLGDIDAVREINTRLASIAGAATNVDLMSNVDLARGWVLAQQGRVDDGIELMEQALADRPPHAARYSICLYLSLIADFYLRQGRFDQGERRLSQAQENADRCNDRSWQAEIHRLNGRARQLKDDADIESARRYFEQALEIARAQSAKTLELRAASDLARLMRDEGDHEQARELLAPVYDWFTEGFETADLRGARALLDELA